LILSTHNVTLTKTIEDRVVKKLEQLDHFDKRGSGCAVTLEHDHKRVRRNNSLAPCGSPCAAPTFLLKARETDLYAAIDVVAKKIEQTTPQASQQNQGAQTQGRHQAQKRQARRRSLMILRARNVSADHRAAHSKNGAVVISGNQIRAPVRGVI